MNEELLKQHENTHFLEDGYYIEKLQQELQRKDNIINELKQNKRDYERENILEMKLHILDNNWNELKEFILNHYIVGHKVQNSSLDMIINKMKELEEND